MLFPMATIGFWPSKGRDMQEGIRNLILMMKRSGFFGDYIGCYMSFESWEFGLYFGSYGFKKGLVKFYKK